MYSPSPIFDSESYQSSLDVHVTVGTVPVVATHSWLDMNCHISKGTILGLTFQSAIVVSSTQLVISFLSSSCQCPPNVSPITALPNPEAVKNTNKGEG